MSKPLDAWETTAASVAQVQKNTQAAEAVTLRADVLCMTQVAEDAVLRPAEPGCWSHAMRAAIACRIARLNNCTALADHYLAQIGSNELEALADPTSTNAPDELRPSLTFTDRVAARPRDITAKDIEILQDAGVSDADIVRLSELNAFLAYQIRLVAGLQLLVEEGS